MAIRHGSPIHVTRAATSFVATRGDRYADVTVEFKVDTLDPRGAEVLRRVDALLRQDRADTLDKMMMALLDAQDRVDADAALRVLERDELWRDR